MGDLSFPSKKIIITAAGFILLMMGLLHITFPIPDSIDYSRIITDNKGDILHIYLTKDEKWRMETPLEEISPLLRKIIIEKEDRYFYYHTGINPMAVGRAAIKNLLRMKRTSGASTITMQVARALERKPRTYFNKLTEMFRALQLELLYSKEEILQLYLNLIPYGGNIEGVKAASLIYLKKSPDHLSLAEITALSIIPNRPSSLVPGKHNDRIIKERNRWLHRFAHEGVFTKETIKDALEEPFTARRNKVPALLPHLSQQLRKRNETLTRTHIDLNMQTKIEKLVKDYSRSLALKNICNAAVVVIDNKTMKLVSYIGSADFNDSANAGQVNGVPAVRQPGSTLKPLLYTLCIDKGMLTPRTMVTDVAVNFNGYAPENYDQQFRGNVSMEYALEHSLNIPAVKSLRLLGEEKLIETLSSCGFRQIKKDRKELGLSMILGGCGASLEELTALYTVFAREGIYQPPSVTEQDQQPSPVRVISKAAAFMINETLSKVNRPDFPINWQSTERMPKIAWKTGTSYGRRDGWSIGYNQRFTVGVWVGNFSGEAVPELSGANTATPLLFRIFNTIDYDSDQEWFRQPEDCDMRIVCPETGMIPDEHCRNRISDYFIPLISSSARCNHLQEIAISPSETISYCKSCQPANGYKKKLFPHIAPELQLYFNNNGISYNRIPPHNPDCEHIIREGAPIIRFPQNGSEYLLSKKDPEPLQLSCHAGAEVTNIHWYINNRFYRSSKARETQFFMPEEGPNKISCTDDTGRNQDIWIYVRYIHL